MPPKREQQQADDHLRHPVPGGQRDVELVLAEIGRVAREHVGVVVHRLAGQDPADVRPVGAFSRRVRIAFVIRMLVMNAMRGDPENRSALERERAAHGEEVLHPLRRLVAAVRQQAVIAHADAQRTGDPPQEHRHGDGAPVDEEKSRNGEDVETPHGDGRDGVHLAVGGLSAINVGHRNHVDMNSIKTLLGAL